MGTMLSSVTRRPSESHPASAHTNISVRVAERHVASIAEQYL
jgi:hypothetical protein